MNPGILQYAGTVFILLWIVTLLKKNSEIGIGVLLAGSVLLFLWILSSGSQLFRFFYTISRQAGISGTAFKVILKILGIGYIADFCARTCKDQGLDAIAYQMETYSKVVPEKSWPKVKQTLANMKTYKAIKQDIADMQWRIDFIKGKKSIENEWDAYIANFKKLGVDDMIRVQQESYNDYLNWLKQ